MEEDLYEVEDKKFNFIRGVSLAIGGPDSKHKSHVKHEDRFPCSKRKDNLVSKAKIRHSLASIANLRWDSNQKVKIFELSLEVQSYTYERYTSYNSRFNSGKMVQQYAITVIGYQATKKKSKFVKI